MEKGVFITIEGVEGSGKTTQARLLGRALGDQGYRCVNTREPGGTKIGSQVRALLLNPESGNFDNLAELFLYEACRAQLAGEVILPNIEKGNIVICDRFTDSTLAYQGSARGLNEELVCRLNRMAARDAVPDRTVFLDIDPEEGLRRARSRNEVTTGKADESRFENESLEFHMRVREGFMRISEAEPGRFKVISALGSIDQIHKRVLKEVSSCLPEI